VNLALDLQVFCKETTSGDVVAGCFGRGGDFTYLNWIIKAWGWTLSVSLLALIVALVIGSLIGIIRTAPNKWLALFGAVRMMPGPRSSATTRSSCRSSSGTTWCRR